MPKIQYLIERQIEIVPGDKKEQMSFEREFETGVEDPTFPYKLEAFCRKYHSGWTLVGCAEFPRESTTELWEPLEKVEAPGPYGEEIWVSPLYQVNRRTQLDLVHLSIKRRDKRAFRDWRHMQAIKNQLVGEGAIGFEIYPPEERLVDTSNQYHLWCIADGMAHYPGFAFDRRLVAEITIEGSVQRPFEDALKPKDLMTKEEVLEDINKSLGHLANNKDSIIEKIAKLRGGNKLVQKK